MNRRRVTRLFTVILLAGYGGLLAAMGLVPERMGQAVYPGSSWSLLLAVVLLCYCAQIAMVVVFAIVPDLEHGG